MRRAHHLRPDEAHAVDAGVDHEAGEAFLAALCVHGGEHDVVVGDARVRDEDLAAVEDIVGAVEARGRADRGDVAAGLRLGHRKGRHRAPFDGVLTHGFTMDSSGKKMSKSRGNVVAPDELVDRYGARAPLTAAVEAQALAAQSSIDFIRSIGFTSNEDGEDFSAVRSVTFTYSTRNTDTGLDREATLTVPLLTIKPAILRAVARSFDSTWRSTSCTARSSSETAR